MIHQVGLVANEVSPVKQRNLIQPELALDLQAQFHVALGGTSMLNLTSLHEADTEAGFVPRHKR